jgi:FdrA protein
VAAHLVALAEKCGKPVVVNFLGASPPRARGQVYFAATLEEAARLALRLSGTEVPPVVPPSGTAVRWAGEQRWLRGLFCGGTLCAEAQVVLRERLGRVWSNTPVSPEAALEDPLVSREHTALDLGADEFTWGRLHPMLDPSVRSQKMIQEAQDAEVAVLLVDVVLGYGAHPDPADEVARAWEEARGRARQGGRDLVCVASVCGTDEDPQGYPRQVHRLREAGVLVAPTNAAAAASAAAVLPPGARSGPASALPSLEVASERAELPPVPEPVRRLLSGPLRVVNVGLEQFAESLRSQGVPVVSVDWRPPASGDTEMLDLLARLGG